MHDQTMISYILFCVDYWDINMLNLQWVDLGSTDYYYFEFWLLTSLFIWDHLNEDWLLFIDWMWIQLSRLCSIDMIAYYEGSVVTILIVTSSWIFLLLSSPGWCILEDKMLLSTLVALEYCFRWHSLVDLCVHPIAFVLFCWSWCSL